LNKKKHTHTQTSKIMVSVVPTIDLLTHENVTFWLNK